MVSLIALIVGGLGVGATMQSHLRQKMTNIAFMKCIGGRSEHILYIYLAQALWLGILGSVLGRDSGRIRAIGVRKAHCELLRCPGDADLAGGRDAAGDRCRTRDDRVVLSAAAAGDPCRPARDIAAESLRRRILGSAGPRKLDRGRQWPLRAFGESQCGSANHCFMRPCSPEA